MATCGLLARVSAGQSSVRRQLAKQPIGERLHGIFLVLLGLGLIADRDGRALNGRRGRIAAACRIALWEH